MNHYRTYMDRQRVSGDLHDRLLHLEPGKNTAVLRRSGPWTRAAALAACCALIMGLGVWRGVPSLGAGSPGNMENILPDQAEQAPAKSFASDWDVSDSHGFLADSGEDLDRMMFPFIPAIVYPDLTEALPPDSASLAKWPNGAFSVDLTADQVCLLLWGSQEALDQAHLKEKPGNVPWMLFWDGFTLFGTAQYDGEGSLLQVNLRGEHPDGRRFGITLAPGRLPAACVVRDGAQLSEFNGVEVQAWSTHLDSDGDGIKEYHYDSAFLTRDIGVQAAFTIPDTTVATRSEDETGALVPQYDLLSTLFIRWACSSPGLTLDHLLINEDIPAWRSQSFETLDQARQETAFAPYLPQQDLSGYGEFDGHLTYQEGTANQLGVAWSKGYDSVRVSVRLPEGGPPECRPVDASDPAGYDVRLYEIPWCDSVPAEYRLDFYSPTFHAEDMTREIVAARQTEKDTGGSTFHFKVLHSNGVLVEYSCDGLTVDQVWSMVESTLS